MVQDLEIDVRHRQPCQMIMQRRWMVWCVRFLICYSVVARMPSTVGWVSALQCPRKQVTENRTRPNDRVGSLLYRVQLIIIFFYLIF